MGQGETTITDLLPALRREEVGSSSAVVPVFPTPPVGGPHALDDSPKADAWLELMKRRGTFDELVAFFYDSIIEMARHIGAFFGL